VLNTTGTTKHSGTQVEEGGTLGAMGSRRASVDDFYDLIPLNNNVSFSGSFAARFEHNQQFHFQVRLEYGAMSITSLRASVTYPVIFCMNNRGRGAIVKLVRQFM
jgi:hypothetical protein